MNSKDDIRGSSRMRIVLAPAGRRVSDACHEQKCLNIFARTRNLSSPFFLIERPCFILDMINQISSHRARSKDSNRSTGERVFDVQFLLPTFLYGVLSKFFSFFFLSAEISCSLSTSFRNTLRRTLISFKGYHKLN